MKIITLRPWSLALTLLVAITALAWLRAHAQTAPPPAPKPAPAAPETTKQPARKKIPRPASAGAYYAQKMNLLVLPKLEFQETSMEDALEFLRTMSRDLDTLETEPSRKGVNIILKPGGEPAPITLSLIDVPMAEALKYITELAGMKFKIEPYAVVVIPKADWVGDMYTRTFEVPPNFLTSGAGGKEQTPQEILTAHGVMFPEGAAASYLPATSQLILRNTQSNLDTAEVLVDALIDAWEKDPQPAPSVTLVTSSGNPIPAAPQPGLALPGLPMPVPGGYGDVIDPNTVPPRVVTAPLTTPTPTQKQRTPGQVQYGFPSPGGSTMVADPRARVEQILRESELKVLLRHYEVTLAESADAEKALTYETDNAKQEALALKIRGLREWKSRLQADIRALNVAGAGTSSTSAVSPESQKVPILTDIPLLGPLFESPKAGTTSSKADVPGLPGLPVPAAEAPAKPQQ
jgi:hypothetical protein